MRDDGEIGDVVGFVLTAGEAGLRIRDRRGELHELAWGRVMAWRAVGVARGRDPLSTPLTELDALAAVAGVTGRVLVARLSDLLDQLTAPPVGELGSPAPQPAVVDGEWVTTGATHDLIPLAWWAAHQDARSIQVRTTDDAGAARLLASGFTERTT
ncbi:MAG: hypothetical protein ACOH1Y_06275 [Propionicimonas sp.]